VFQLGANSGHNTFYVFAGRQCKPRVKNEAQVWQYKTRMIAGKQLAFLRSAIEHGQSHPSINKFVTYAVEAPRWSTKFYTGTSISLETQVGSRFQTSIINQVPAAIDKKKNGP
jgi:hypothetical protein